MLDPLSLRVLRNENRPEPVDTILFLGAGASEAFGYPTSTELIDQLRLDEKEREWIRSFSNIDEAMRHCHKLLAGKKENSEVLEAITRNAVKEIVAIIPEERRQEVVEKITNIPEMYNKLVNMAGSIKEKVIEGIFREYTYREITENYLDEYIQLLRKQNGDHLPIFTTNYDPAVETLEMKEYKVNTLFILWMRALYRWEGQEAFKGKKREKDTIYLFKLHGSTYWRWIDGKLCEERTFSRLEAEIEEIIPPGMEVGIDRNREPYITYWDYFDAYLSQAKRAVFLGYRFDDEEILKLLRNKELEKIIIVNPEEVEADLKDLKNVRTIKKKAQDAVKDVEAELESPPQTE